MEEFDNIDLKLNGKIYGAAPVQAEGTINGYLFYFRARWDTWTFSISENSDISPEDIDMPEAGKKYGYFAEGHIGKEWEYLASYMDINMAKEIIVNCSTEYLKNKL